VPYSKEPDKKPLELITDSIRAIGFEDEKVVNMLGILIYGMALPDFRGKMIDFEQTHMMGRKACTKFISNDPGSVKKTLQEKVWDSVRKEYARLAAEGANPVTYMFTDDTIHEFSPPASTAKRKMEAGGYHYSHTTLCQVFGHQILTVLISIGDKVFVLDQFIFNSNLDAKSQKKANRFYEAAQEAANILEEEISALTAEKYEASAFFEKAVTASAAANDLVTKAQTVCNEAKGTGKAKTKVASDNLENAKAFHAKAKSEVNAQMAIQNTYALKIKEKNAELTKVWKTFKDELSDLKEIAAGVKEEWAYNKLKSEGVDLSKPKKHKKSPDGDNPSADNEDFYSKVQFLILFALSLPDDCSLLNVIFMADRWFTGELLIKAFLKKGCKFVGAIKLNRLIRPDLSRSEILASSYARIIAKDKCVPVKDGDIEYLVHEYIGPITGFEKVKIFITWPKEQFKNASKAKGFLSTDTEMTASACLNHYGNRWLVEIFYRTMKDIGLDDYQIQSKDLLENFLWVYALLHYICVECVKDPCAFTDGFSELQSQVEDAELFYAFNYARTHSIKEYLLRFKK
jgi:hypothetical protein